MSEQLRNEKVKWNQSSGRIGAICYPSGRQQAGDAVKAVSPSRKWDTESGLCFVGPQLQAAHEHVAENDRLRHVLAVRKMKLESAKPVILRNRAGKTDRGTWADLGYLRTDPPCTKTQVRWAVIDKAKICWSWFCLTRLWMRHLWKERGVMRRGRKVVWSVRIVGRDSINVLSGQDHDWRKTDTMSAKVCKNEKPG